MKEFIETNEVRIGEDFTIGQPIYYYSLLSTLRHYFSTYQNVQKTAHFSFDFKNNSRKGLAFGYSDNYNVKHAISSCQNLFELFLKEQLQKYHTNEEVKSMNFPRKISALTSLYKETTDFSNYTFLEAQANLDFLNNLNQLRNKLVHDASLSINIHALDFLISQYAIPIIYEILLADIESGELKSDFRYLTTNNGRHILSEISRIKFESNWFEDTSKHDLLQRQLVHLAQLKELGRANVNRTMIKNLDDTSYDFFDSKYSNPHLRNEKFAQSEETSEHFYGRKECPSCGVNSLVIYQFSIESPFDDEMTMIGWFRCYTCSYNGANNMGDPHFFGICDEPLLPILSV